MAATWAGVMGRGGTGGGGSYVSVLDAGQLPLQNLYALGLGEHHRAQGLHLRQDLVQHVVLGGRESGVSEGRIRNDRR